MRVKRLIYLGYYIKELDWAKFNKFLNYVSTRHKKSKMTILIDILTSVLKYNIAPIDYFLFRFYEIQDQERGTYAGTGYLYEYQLRMNPISTRSVLENKLEFLNHYKSFIKHNHFSLLDIKNDHTLASRILSNGSGKIVLKNSSGQCGYGVEVRNCQDFSPETLIERLKENKNDLVEEFIIQHNKLMQLSSTGLNTIRIITQLDTNGDVKIIAARLRISVNSHVDNLAAGNLAAPINLETGKVYGGAVYSDITKEQTNTHPLTGVEIIGFEIPYWKETIKMVKDAALMSKGNRSIGWDIAITNEGPELLEGNHNWCKLLWQLPVRRGLKYELEKYL